MSSNKEEEVKESSDEEEFKTLLTHMKKLLVIAQVLHISYVKAQNDFKILFVLAKVNIQSGLIIRIMTNRF